jgi:transposase InsO family protein
MGQKVIGMDIKLLAMLAGDHGGQSVTTICAQFGISRQTFYVAQRRYLAEGVVGLLGRSRRPGSSPGQTPAALEERIVQLRLELSDSGLDNGALSIWYRLRRAGVAPPAVSTIHRVLRRHGQIVDAPAKRPRSSWTRFGFPRPNDCWQVDATSWWLADGTEVKIFRVIDDHSRLLLASRVAPGETSADAWAVMLTAFAAHGLPELVLSDNGAAFSGKRRGWPPVAFETNLRALGIRPITSRLYHPQTCGKNERSHQPLQRWLRRQPVPRSISELQRQVDAFDQIYNTSRPHQALAGAYPAEAWAATERGGPKGEPVPAPRHLRSHQGQVGENGAVRIAKYKINVGREWAYQDVTILIQHLDVAVFHHDQLLRELTIDPTRRYQPSGRKRGRTRKDPRLLSAMS